MLDDENFIAHKDPDGALNVAAGQWQQTKYDATVIGDMTSGVTGLVVSGMGGSALAALMAKKWLGEMTVPFEIVRGYELPNWVNESTLVISSSYSGNTEETVSGLSHAEERRARSVVIASGGKLIDAAKEKSLPYVQLPDGLQPRMAVIYNLRALVRVLVSAGLVEASRYDEIAETATLLQEESAWWAPSSPLEHNYAKQLAQFALGKTPVVYGGALTAPVAYKWKISFNENAKNVAFWNEYPEFNHNEFIGWTSHPIEKPFAVFDLVSRFEHPQILKRFEISDRLLSGQRPKSKVVELKGDTLIAQLLWGSIFADFVTIYVAILNGVNPVPVPLIEKLKKELV